MLRSLRPTGKWKKQKTKKQVASSDKQNCCLVAKSCLTLLRAPWTVAHQTPLSMGFPRQEYRSGLPFPFPAYLPTPGIEPMSPDWQADSLPLSHHGSPLTK